MTFESGYRHLDRLGDRFGVIVVDEVHHFAGGLRSEALEMCPAPSRLGLTATPPVHGSAGAARLAELVGPVVCEVGLRELQGTHLAELAVVRFAVKLEPAERAAYERAYRPFSMLRAAFLRANLGSDWISCVRAMARTRDGRSAITGFHRAMGIARLGYGTSPLAQRHPRYCIDRAVECRATRQGASRHGVDGSALLSRRTASRRLVAEK